MDQRNDDERSCDFCRRRPTIRFSRPDRGKAYPRPALFLDRDGVINHDTGYTHRVADLIWIDGARSLIRAANDLGALVIVVTNQGGIGLGYYNEADMHTFHRAISAGLAADGAQIDAFYWAPHHPDAVIEALRHPDHPDRKPNPGMLLCALGDWDIDIAASAMIGDRVTDMEAASRAGITGILFRGGNVHVAAEPALQRMRERAAAG